MTEIAEMVKMLNAVPPGQPGWSDFENICTKILSYLLVSFKG